MGRNPILFLERSTRQKVLKTSVLPYDYEFAIRDYGKVWKIDQNQPIVVCGEGLLKIDHAIDNFGPCVYVNKVRVRFH